MMIFELQSQISTFEIEYGILFKYYIQTIDYDSIFSI